MLEQNKNNICNFKLIPKDLEKTTSLRSKLINARPDINTSTRICIQY